MRPSAPPFSSGYTLAELLVVLAIIVILAVLVLPYSPHTRRSPQDSQPDMAVFLKQQREASMRTGKTVCILVSQDKLQAVPAGAEYLMRKGETLRMLYPETSRILAQQTGTCFQPDGGMTEANWMLGVNNIDYNIKLSPFSGAIAIIPQSQDLK